MHYNFDYEAENRI